MDVTENDLRVLKSLASTLELDARRIKAILQDSEYAPEFKLSLIQKEFFEYSQSTKEAFENEFLSLGSSSDDFSPMPQIVYDKNYGSDQDIGEFIRELVQMGYHVELKPGNKDDHYHCFLSKNFDGNKLKVKAFNCPGVFLALEEAYKQWVETYGND